MTSVLEEVAEGRLQIPRFQRPLVWSWPQRRDLLSSIYEGLPIGALMVWVSADDHVECYDKLGPYPLPKPILAASRFLMDGVQRVSTLYGALRAAKTWTEIDAETNQTVADFSVLFDLDSERDEDRFVREADLPKDATKTDPSRYLPLREIMDTRRLVRFQRQIGPGLDHRLDAADEVAAAFRQYKIPLITLNNASLETVTKSFQRVNSRGASMSEMHMINALTYSPQFDLLQNEANLRHELLADRGWHDIDQDVVLRSLKLELGVPLYSTEPEMASERMRSNPGSLEKVFRGLRSLAAAFDRCIQLKSPDLFPYKLQIISLAYVFANRGGMIHDRRLLDWFWMTTYTEAFGISARQSEVTIADLGRFVETGHFRWGLKQKANVRSLQGRKPDFRSARGRALALSLSLHIDRSSGDGSGMELLNRYRKDAFFSAALSSKTRGRAGFRFVLAPHEGSQFRKCLFDLGLTRSERKRHMISDEAYEFLLVDDEEAFADQRESEIFRYERDTIFGPAISNLAMRFSVTTAGQDGGEERSYEE
ncbi:DUF262 domain-containing protein [Lichenibacterium minor]|nr:DUF262 domain-containing protein [Lichenibacterium minor]